MADEELCKAVELLIKLGFKVIDTKIVYNGNIKITIHIAGAVPAGLLYGLPGRWRLRYGNRLCCSATPTTGENAILSMVGALESFLLDMDADAVKAILLLAGYEGGEL